MWKSKQNLGVGVTIIVAKGELRLECGPQYGSLRLAHNTCDSVPK